MYTQKQRAAAKKWLGEIDSHVIYDDAAMRAEYLKVVGVEAPWVGYSPAQTRQALRARGLGGSLDAGAGKCCYGYSMADSIARAALSQEDYLKIPSKHGRGSQFWECHKAL